MSKKMLWLLTIIVFKLFFPSEVIRPSGTIKPFTMTLLLSDDRASHKEL